MTDRIPCCELSDQSTVNLWVVDLDDRSVPDATLDAILSPDEKKRAARFLFEPDAWHFKLCRVMLRIGLALHLGKTAKGIQITTTEKGKPFLDEGDLHWLCTETERQWSQQAVQHRSQGIDLAWSGLARLETRTSSQLGRW